MFDDTIVAQVTPYGKSSVGVLRISGNNAKNVAYKILGKLPFPREVCYSKFLNHSGVVIDTGIALWFSKPYSFTGEDILELQSHGNPIILDLLLKTILSIKNTRLAQAGEFSKRAFLNGKIDLLQAESIMDLINADTEISLKSSLRSLQGEFSKKINILINNITKIRMLIEAVINFPEDNIFLSNNIISKKLNKILLDIKIINKVANIGNIFREGIKIVIVGQPNAGKSSLFNSLLLNDIAIVTDIEGTTRDALHERINIDGLIFQLIDTAGLRDTKDKIEIMSINKTLEQINLSDYILLVIDDTHSKFKKKKIISNFINSFSMNKKVTVVFNKSDLSGNKFCSINKINNLPCINVSAKTYFGIKMLKKHLKNEILGISEKNITEEVFLARRRHLNILELAIKNINKAYKNWKNYKNIEFLAEDLKYIQSILNNITGSITSDTILNSIFSEFCIGK